MLTVSLLEALATGTPVVASDLPGLSDAVTGGAEPAGLLVEPGDTAGLTAALTRLLGDDDERERMGRAARTRAAVYSVDVEGCAVRRARPGGRRPLTDQAAARAAATSSASVVERPSCPLPGWACR